MTQDLETILRKSLDEADRNFRRFVAIWIFMAIADIAGLVCVYYGWRTADVRTLLFYSVVVLLVSYGVYFILTCAYVTVMTRKTLKAIELLSKE
jgi:uncharacterized membrane protein YoaK (UPF0700 family)